MLFNQARAEEVMARAGVEALIATSPENVMYASDYECVTHWINKGFQVYSIFTPNHKPKASLIAPSLELEAIVDGKVWIEDIYIFSPFKRGPAQGNEMDAVGKAGKALLERASIVSRALEGLIAAIESRGLQNSRIAVDELGMSPFIFWELKQRFPNADIIAGNPMWWEIRMIKTPDEIQRLRMASRITELAVNHAYGLIKPGVRESEIVHAYNVKIAELKGKPTFMLMGSGSRSSYPHMLVSEKPIEKGDIVRYDIGCTYDYYHSDTARAVVYGGKPSLQQQRLWDALSSGVEDAIALIKPGADVRDIYRAAMKPGKTLGLEDFDRFHCGHGIGISVYDPPVVTISDPATSAFLMPSVEGGLRPGMSLNVEVGYYMQGVQGMLCEDTMVVTETGCERLTNNSKSLIYDDFMAAAVV
ncbi:Xaa-Pro peptidase family protein [Ferrovibrio sp. MS7]|jgi:Xaa-Pro dipeptidase|uniref:Xaa-Pro peptidase family protein n=1 Tax=Ferrovibrio plantarum TaxID=3119164 RepID=UPI0031373C7E